MSIKMFNDRRSRGPARYRRLAQEQGVERPFRILVNMPDPVRAHLAAVLGLRIRGAGDSPEAQAWRIINSDLKGLQARSHGPREQFVPLVRNNNWWEILLAASRKLRLRIYPGLSEREVERRVFDEIARRVVGGLPSHEVQALDHMASAEPSLTVALSNLGLSRDGLRLVLAGFGRLARTGGAPQERPARRGSERTPERLGCLHSLSRALRYTKDRFGSLVVAWTSMEALRRALGRPRARFVSVVMALYFHNLLEEGLDECELLKA